MKRSFLKMCSTVAKENMKSKIPKKRGLGKTLFFSSAALTGGTLYAMDYCRVINFKQILQFYKLKRDEEEVEREMEWSVIKAEKFEKKRVSFSATIVKMLDLNLWCRSFVEAFFLAIRSVELVWIFSPVAFTLEKAVKNLEYRQIWFLSLILFFQQN